MHAAQDLKTGWPGVGIMCPSGATRLSICVLYCCLGELVLYNRSHRVGLVQSRYQYHLKSVCFRHDIDGKGMLTWR